MLASIENKTNGECLDVWHLNLDNFSSTLPYQHLLSDAELARARRFKFDLDRQRFICRRIALKRILSQYSDRSPEQLIINEVDRNKPQLPYESFHFNTSHSNNIGLVAVSDQPIGVDIEYHIDTLEDLNLLANNVLAEDELTQFLGLDELAAKRCFYQFWTLKEAYLKAIGAGLSVEPRQIAFNLQPLKITQTPTIEPQLAWQPFLSEKFNDYSLAIVSLNNNIQPNFIEFSWP